MSSWVRVLLRHTELRAVSQVLRNARPTFAVPAWVVRRGCQRQGYDGLAFTTGTIPAYDPVTMSLARVVRFLPLARHHRAAPNLDNQISNRETRLFCHAHKITVRPA